MDALKLPYSTLTRAGSAVKARTLVLTTAISMPVAAQELSPSEPRPDPETTESDVPVVQEAEIDAVEAPNEAEAAAEEVQVPRETATVAARPPSLSLPSRPPGGDQPMFGTFEGTYGLAGLTTGFSFDEGGFLLGGELSVVRQMQEFAWFGGYVDAVYDFQRKQTRLSIGPEFGWSALGLDAGYLVALDGDGAQSGITARPLISIGYITAFGRVSHLFEDERTWVEAGLLLKYPVEF